MKNKVFGKISLAIITFILIATPAFAVENDEATSTDTNYAYEQMEENVDESVTAQEEPIAELKDKEEIETKQKPEKVEKQEVKASKGEEVVNYAKKFIGTPYVYGGSSLTDGTDCSGFSSGVYRKFGISLQRRSRDQYSSNGVKVSRSELEPGDLVFFGYDGSVTHVGIYAGNNNMVHASSSRGVVVDSLDLRGMAPIVGYKRVL